MPSSIRNHRVGDTISAVAVSVEIQDTQFHWPVDYANYSVSGYAYWILPMPEDLATLVGWRLLVRKRLNNGTASTDPTEFIKNLMRSSESSSWGSLQTKLGQSSDNFRQYFYPQPKRGPKSVKGDKYPIRWMSTDALKILIIEASLRHRTRRGESTYPTVAIDLRQNCKPLRPTETGSMLRVLDQDELYARLGSAWKVHIRDRRRLDERPGFEDLPWLVKKASAIANELWSRHTVFEKRCIAKVARRRLMQEWPDYLDY